MKSLGEFSWQGILKVDLSTPPPATPHSWGEESSKYSVFPPSFRKSFSRRRGASGDGDYLAIKISYSPGDGPVHEQHNLIK
jgi:hypothetical protein